MNNCEDMSNSTVKESLTVQALTLALEALESKYIVGCSSWRFQQDETITAIKAALEAHKALTQPEQKYTTTRNAWTGTATHKCNQCGREDFRSEHAAKFHKCEASKEPEQDKQDRWLDIHFPETTPYVATPRPQRTWVGLTDEDDIDWEEGGNLKDLVKAIEAKLKEKNT